MGRHSSGESPDLSVKLLIATPVCLILGVFAVWMGVVKIHEPATCEFKTMTASDVCQLGRKLLDERLVVDRASNAPDVNYRDLTQQQSYNRVAAPVYVLIGVLFAACSVWLGALQARGLRARRELRRRQRDWA